MADKKKLTLEEINTRNRAGQGWKLSDFGTYSGEPFQLPDQPQYRGIEGTTFNRQVGPPQPPMASPTTTKPVTEVLSPAEIERVRTFVQNPQELGIVSGAVNSTATFLSNLFNTDDEKETIVESAWDGLFKGLMWPVDQVNHLTAAAISAAPGGMRTLTWDEANDVSTGQALVTDYGTRAGMVRRGEANIFDVAGFASPIGAIAGAAAFNNPDSPVQQAGFDVTTPEGKKAFDSGYEKFFSGVTDFGMAFADPLFLAGGAAKLARIKFVDRLVVTDAQRARLVDELKTGYTAPPGQAAPIAEFNRAVTEINPETGQKVMSYDDIYNHKAIRNSTNREILAKAYYNARDVTVTDVLDPSKSKSISGYDLSSLITRWAYGDKDAARQLAEVRADMADALALGERNRIAVSYALNPEAREKSIKVAESAVEKADRQIRSLERQGLAGTADWEAATRAKGIAQSTVDDLVDGKFDILQQNTPEAKALASRVFKDLVANNDALRAAIGSDRATAYGGIMGSLQDSTKGFAANNRVGRRIEQRRLKQAKATTTAQQTRGRVVGTGQMTARGGRAEKMERVANPFNRSFWTADEYGDGFTRNVIVWRRASAEAPAGFIITKGLGAQEGYRELRAVLNGIKLFSGDARRVVIDDGSVVLVGGAEKKRQMLETYAQALAQNVEGGMDAAKALRQIEREIESNMFAWYGVNKDTAQNLMEQAFKSRQRLMEGMTDQNRGFWVDEQGKFNLVKDAWLDSQLQNGTFMQNYRELERLLGRTEKTGLMGLLSDGTAVTGRTFSTVARYFNEIWRPLVLMRLGYTMRNVIEGQVRAAAFTASLDPFSAAMVNAGYSARGLFGKLAGHQNIDRVAAEARINAAKSGGRKLPRKFEPWLRTQIQGRMRQNNEFQAYIASTVPDIAKHSPEIRTWGLDWYQKTISKLSSDSANARRLGSLDEADAIDEVITTMMKQMDQVNSIKTFEKYTPDVVETFNDLRFNAMLLDDGYRKLDLLNDDATALSMFYRQGKARARAYSGTVQTPDSKTLYSAFNPENPFTPVALSLLSADSTTKSMVGGRTASLESLFRAKSQTNYAIVKPSDPKYWESLSNAIAQVRFSSIGSRIMRGQTDDEIVNFLLTDRDGIETLRFLNGAVTKEKVKKTGEVTRVKTAREAQVGGKAVMIGKGVEPGPDVARFFVEQARSRYEQLTPNLGFRSYVESQPSGVEYTAKQLESAFKDAGGDTKALHAVVGTHLDEFGLKNPMDVWRTFTGYTMKWLGTIPEDTFVRSPFYGARYQASTRRLVDIAMKQSGGTVTMREIDTITRQAHARALKDTKDWLYTIDRPTLLGSIGETTVPFISAAQNSMTTLGRLVYNDPNTAVVLASLWRAPTAAGMEDESGNIVIPIPHEWVPDGVEKFFGLDAMQNWKIKKNQLNVIVPESGFAFVPRPGPLVAVPVSELMKRGWLGQQVESPEILRTVLGGKEQADQVWNVYKAFMFGEGQGAASDPNSLSMFLPPVGQRMMRLFQQEGNQQFGYNYNLIMRSQWALYSAGMRDQPTKQEILNQTVGFELLRLIANLTAITPPQYESVIDPMVQTVRYYERTYPEDAPRIINEKFGPVLQMLGDFSNSQSNAGMLANADTVERSRKYSDIIAKTAPVLDERGDMSVLTMLAMNNANQLYDDSAYAWQFANRVPGTNKSYREWQSAQQSWIQSDVNAGWATYLRGEDGFQARLRQMGLTSFDKAPELKAERDAWLSDMANNPFFENWYRDYKDYGSSRTMSAVYMMNELVNDQRFMDDNKDNIIWQFAPLYLYHRDRVLNALQESGKGIDNPDNIQIREYWDSVRADLNSYPQWSAFSNRFLNGDDAPEAPGVTFM